MYSRKSSLGVFYQVQHKPGYASIHGGCRSLDLENRGIRYFVCSKTNALISGALSLHCSEVGVPITRVILKVYNNI